MDVISDLQNRQPFISFYTSSRGADLSERPRGVNQVAVVSLLHQELLGDLNCLLLHRSAHLYSKIASAKVFDQQATQILEFDVAIGNRLRCHFGRRCFFD